ncbi:MAG: hypothetical protein INQ03_20180 [Candidatus Heimdallarchaeota archaeon]|nr:hypothetical protein [Candidatus Heimdallarchaeota archaeon]
MSRFEYNPLSVEHVIIAPHRKKRPFQEKVVCPFCIGAPEVPEEINHPISLPNKFPTLSMDYPHAKGICEVILYSSNHDIPLSQRSELFVQEVIKHWIKRSKEISSIQEIEYIFIFENYGKDIGVSLEHPHGQLYAFPILPRVIRDKLDAIQENCPFCNDSLSHKIEEGEYFVVSVPNYSKWPFELNIYPQKHIGKLMELGEDQIRELSILLKKSLQILDNRYDHKVPYILSVFQAPVHQDGFHLHIELISPQINNDRLKYRAGIETSLGIFINSLEPEQVATEIRDIWGKLK